jgi:hypothetical protein
LTVREVATDGEHRAAAGRAPVIQWQFSANDWVTAIDTLRDDFIFVGSRDGSLRVLDWFGTCILERQFGSWIGAVRLLHVANVNGVEEIYLWLGTKRGQVICERVLIEGGSRVTTETCFEFDAKNTIREIEVPTGLVGLGDAIVVAGSEDRRVYVFPMERVLGGVTWTPFERALNGWVRSVALCRTVSGDILIAAGCGDKRVHFLDLNAQEVGSVLVDSKVHSIVSDPRGSRLFCCSDSKELFEIALYGGPKYQFSLERRMPLPHRATKLVFIDANCERIIAVCEDKCLYVIDATRHLVCGSLSLGERVFALHALQTQTTKVALIGHGQRSLSSVLYWPDEHAASHPSARFGLPDEFESPPRWPDLAEVHLHGSRTARISVGIGRFLDLVPAARPFEELCVVSTDEGDVHIVELFGETGATKVTIPRESVYRVWAAHAFWTEPGTWLKVLVATSDKMITAYDVDMTTTIALRGERTQLGDWPREIRPVENAGAGVCIVACESGELHITSEPSQLFNGNQIFRTAYGVKRRDQVDVLTGSDNCLVTLYANGIEQWRVRTADRVREVLIDKDECLAVSEDRFLYVLDASPEAEGRKRYRFRFPHRALCADVIHDAETKRRIVVVGCGDGAVYWLDENGFVLDAHEFPDRIRDIKVTRDGDIAVACEDRHLYRARTWDRAMKAVFGARGLEAVQTRIRELKVAHDSNGPAVVSEITPAERAFLLRYIDHWLGNNTADFAVRLTDAALRDDYRDKVKLHYWCANALLALATRGRFAFGKDRIEQYLRRFDGNVYAQHSLLAAVGHRRLRLVHMPAGDPAPEMLIDWLVLKVSLDDEWILEECCRKLCASEFFGLGEGGFRKFFRTVRIPYRKLRRIVDHAEFMEQPEVSGSSLVRLMPFLKAGQFDDRAVTKMIDICRVTDPSVRSDMESLTLIAAAPLNDETPLSVVERYTARIANAELRSMVGHILNVGGAALSNGYRGASVVADLVRAKLEADDYEVTADDFLAVQFALGTLRALSVRVA